MQNIRSAGSEKETIAGCGATSMSGSRSMNAYPSSMSIGTRLMLTVVGLIGVFQQRQSGRSRRVLNSRRMILVYQSTSDDIPGAIILLRRKKQILIGEPWDASRLTRYRRVTAASAVGK